MSQEMAFTYVQQCLGVAAELVAPAILATLSVGTAISVFQAATQIQEQSMSFVPKVGALLGALTVSGGWMILRIVEYSKNIFVGLPGLAHH
jgi:flagellar biosynthetic protein FliQ